MFIKERIITYFIAWDIRVILHLSVRDVLPVGTHILDGFLIFLSYANKRNEMLN